MLVLCSHWWRRAFVGLRYFGGLDLFLFTHQAFSWAQTCLILKSHKMEPTVCDFNWPQQENIQEFNCNPMWRNILGQEMRVLTTPCILISVHYMFNVRSLLTVFQVLSGQRSRARQSEQSWLAFLLPLTLLVCQQCHAYGQFVPRWLGCTQTFST